MLTEASFKEAKKWFLWKSLTPNVKLVCVSRYYPAFLGRNCFDMVAPSLAPPKAMLRVYKERLERYKSIAKELRCWGDTVEKRTKAAYYKAFIDAFGVDAVYYRRYLHRSPNAQESLSKIRRWLGKEYTVVLFCYEEKPPCHRYILMQILLGARSLAKMFSNLNYPEEYLLFADYVQGRFRARRSKQV